MGLVWVRDKVRANIRDGLGVDRGRERVNAIDQDERQDGERALTSSSLNITV